MGLANVAIALALIFNAQGFAPPTIVTEHPLSQEDIVLLLLGSSSKGDIVQIVNERGVDFKMNQDLAEEFRDSGASGTLIEALEKAGSKLPTAPANARPTAKESNADAPLTPGTLPAEPTPVTKPIAQGTSVKSPGAGPTRSARVGDLLVTVTRVWLPQAPASYQPDRFHQVAITVIVKNISERISQTNFFPSLKVKPYAEYPWYPWTRTPSSVPKELRINNLCIRNRCGKLFAWDRRSS
jgi:hypothetical protein